MLDAEYGRLNMKKMCATCKHCIWVERGGHKAMACNEYSTNGITVLCGPPYDEACGKYKEVAEGENHD